MKSRRVIILAIVLVLSMMTLVACNTSPIEYGKEYRQVFYDSARREFTPTGNSIVIGDDYKYEEKYKTGIDDYTIFNGKYVTTDDKNMLFMRLESSAFTKFKKSYSNQLKQLGYTSSEIKEIIMPNVVDKTEMFIYKDYVFKASAIIAAKIDTEGYRLNELDGLYRFDGLLDENDSVMKIKLNEIFLEGKNDVGEPTYDEKIGFCELNNDIITITPTVATGGGDPNDAMKYLLADIVFPAKYKENVDKDGRYDENDVITYYENVKVRVIVSNFYTLKDTINRE